jgi:uncharacterized membrane protein YjgN (DUF898 family)
MDPEPDYSQYNLDELLNERACLDREAYPERAQRLEQAINDRTWRPVSDAEQSGVPELALKFHGSAPEYFRIWIVSLCLTLLTLGVYSAWAKVRKKRYLYSHTTLDGTPFQYLGQPIPILKGRLVAATGLLVYWVASHFITSVLPYVFVAGLVLGPWVLSRSLAFNARYSAFRNMTFHFDGGYLDAAKALYAWGFLPVAVLGMALGMVFSSTIGLIVSGIAWALFGISYPWLIRRLKKLSIERTSFGGVHGRMGAKGGDFFGIYFLSGFVLIGLFFLGAIVGGAVSAVVASLPVTVLVMSLASYGAYLGVFAYIQARTGNLVWNQTKLGPLRFQSALRWRGLMKLYVTNALAIVASLGLLTPWAVMRTLKYRAEHMRVLLDGTLAEFQGSERSAVTAAGAESIELFDMDVSLW